MATAAVQVEWSDSRRLQEINASKRLSRRFHQLPVEKRRFVLSGINHGITESDLIDLLEKAKKEK